MLSPARVAGRCIPAAPTAPALFSCLFTVVFNSPVLMGCVFLGSKKRRENHATNNKRQSSSASTDITRIEFPPFRAYIKQGALSLPTELIGHNSFLLALVM